MKKIKVGIIGCGGIANGKHLPVLAKMPDVEIVAGADLIPGKAKAFFERFDGNDHVSIVGTDYYEVVAIVADAGGNRTVLDTKAVKQANPDITSEMMSFNYGHFSDVFVRMILEITVCSVSDR